MTKRFFRTLLIFVVVVGFLCGSTGCLMKHLEDIDTTDKRIKIGVSMWSSSDTVGSRCKWILSDAAKGMNVELVFCDNANTHDRFLDSIDKLIDMGCRGIIVCNCTDEEMSWVIDRCDENEIFVAQFFKGIDQKRDIELFRKAIDSPYYVGSVHEDEVANGRKIMECMIDSGARNISIIANRKEDTAWLDRYEGYKQVVSEWNRMHPLDTVGLKKPYFAGITTKGGYVAVISIMKDESVDGLICAGGGGEPLLGALEGIDASKRSGKVKVIGTGIIDDLGDQIEKGTMIASSGGRFADPMFAMIMVRNAILGTESYAGFSGRLDEICAEHILIDSKDEFEDYKKYFCIRLPYSKQEMGEFSRMTFRELQKYATALSMEDVVERAKSTE